MIVDDSSAGSSTGMSRSAWTVVVLLVASIFINYIDRINLSLAVPYLMGQLSLSPLQAGSLLSAFSWTYALLQIAGISGWITDRFPVRWVLASGFLVWSTATV